MYLHNRLDSKSNFFQKIKEVDFILLAGILLLGIISISTMYSTDGGQVYFIQKVIL
jgi:rod shape determining protein RodA